MTIKEFHKVMEEFSPLMDSWWPYLIGLFLGVITALRNYMAGQKCPSEERIDGKTVVITGASSGMGKEIAIELAKRGGRIILAVRDEKSGKAIAEKIRVIPDAKVDVRKIDLSSLQSIRNFVEKFEVDEVDILINNAGIVFHPQKKTDEGFELHFVTNYLGHFLLTQLLLPKLKASQQGRIINISAESHTTSEIHLDDLNLEEKFSAGEAFGQSKLAMIMMARHMSQLLKDTHVTINAVNPGLVRGTRHMRSSPINQARLLKLIMLPWMWLLMKSPVEGAQTTIYAAVSNSLSEKSGKYLSDCELSNPSELALDEATAEKLFNKSMELVKPFMRIDSPEKE
ncbi:retinol dehydrogenase 13 [Fopius arisanus]|uniref:Retinol dehydrogenase 13 n=1 Tax=Fopius arisanus TaxID=64838 RepID=A0A9R1T9N3_9HYME|nr:PREDICTED: retinol dehydrogenase 13 [Fopius arisanus]